MTWKHNTTTVLAALQKKKAAIDFAVEKATNQGMIMALNEVHARMEGHIVTGNMNDGFDKASEVRKLGDAHYQIVIQTDAENNGFHYPNVVEARFGMMSGGVHAALPQIAANLKAKIEEVK